LKLVPSLLWTNPDGFSAVDAAGRLSSVDPLRTINVGGALEVRLEIDLRPLGPLQLEVGLGYAVRDRTEAWGTFVPKPWQQVAWRHGPLASLTFTLAQRIYVTGSIARWWQPACQVSDVNVGCPDVASAYWSYEPIETTRWPLRLSGGWRALW
jgi:hypothetical protein